MRLFVTVAGLHQQLASGDASRASAISAIRSLQALGIRTVMVTVDNLGSAVAVGSALGIDHIEAKVLLADKAAIPRWWPQQAWH